MEALLVRLALTNDVGNLVSDPAGSWTRLTTSAESRDHSLESVAVAATPAAAGAVVWGCSALLEPAVSAQPEVPHVTRPAKA